MRICECVSDRTVEGERWRECQEWWYADGTLLRMVKETGVVIMNVGEYVSYSRFLTGR